MTLKCDNSMLHDAEAIINYDYVTRKKNYRMPLNERASIL